MDGWMDGWMDGSLIDGKWKPSGRLDRIALQVKTNPEQTLDVCCTRLKPKMTDVNGGR
jgi:hypothetical protein